MAPLLRMGEVLPDMLDTILSVCYSCAALATGSALVIFQQEMVLV